LRVLINRASRKKSDNKKSATIDTSVKQTIEGLTAKDSGSLTIKTATGSQLVSLTPDSHMDKKNKNVSISNLAIGDQINVKAIVNPNGSFTASAIRKSDTATNNSASN
jgi:sRNA-binding protein